MSRKSRNGFTFVASLPVPKMDVRIISFLLEARELAEARGRNAWDFAVELPALAAIGATVNDLRSLICDGLVEHAQETTSSSGRKRRFRRLENLSVPSGTCFVLRLDAAEARNILRGGNRLARSARTRPDLEGSPGSRPALRPRWDGPSRTLFVSRQAIKCYRVPAPSQETILNAFQEEGWPVYIDDPLPPRQGQDAKHRLHNTINALNRHHLCSLLHFHGNGSGAGVGWGFANR